jgi:hypothetical protein
LVNVPYLHRPDYSPQHECDLPKRFLSYEVTSDDPARGERMELPSGRIYESLPPGTVWQCDGCGQVWKLYGLRPLRVGGWGKIRWPWSRKWKRPRIEPAGSAGSDPGPHLAELEPEHHHGDPLPDSEPRPPVLWSHHP